MNATCQVTHRSPGRIHLQLPNTAPQPEVYHRLVQLVLSLPEVTRVELEPASASVTIIHSRAPHARDTILQALRGSAGQQSAPEVTAPAPAPALPGTAQQYALESKTSPPLPAPRPVRSPYADGDVVHAMAGRVRMRIPVLQADGNLAGVLTHFLRQQPGVREVRLSRLSGGIAIAYDPTVTDAKSLAGLVRGYQPDTAAIANWKSNLASRRPGQRQQNVKFQTSLALAGVGLALNFLGAPGFLVFVLLLAASWPVLRRAGQMLFMQRQVSLELLAVTAILLLWVTGRTWQAAVFVALLAVVEWLRSSPYRSLDSVLAGGLDYLKAASGASWTEPQMAAPRRIVTVAGPWKSLPQDSADRAASLAATPPATTVSVTNRPPTQAPIATQADPLIQR